MINLFRNAASHLSQLPPTIEPKYIYIYIIISSFWNIHYAKIFIYLRVQFACFYFLIYFQQLDASVQ